MYSLKFTDNAKKQLKKMDKYIAKLIVNWMMKNIHGSDNPRVHGKALKANLSDYWRYRVGNYRVITEIQDDALVVVAVEIGHRKEIYK